MGVDPLIRKDSKLVGVNKTSVDTLERILLPEGLGKRTIYLPLKQIDGMIAYIRKGNTRYSE